MIDQKQTPNIQSIRECGYCTTPVKDEYCRQCLKAFFFRPRAKGLTNKQKADELIRWKKAEFPRYLIQKRAKEFLNRRVKMKDIIEPRSFRIMVKELQFKEDKRSAKK